MIIDGQKIKPAAATQPLIRYHRLSGLSQIVEIEQNCEIES
jgi:hypothetical protein